MANEIDIELELLAPDAQNVIELEVDDVIGSEIIKKIDALNERLDELEHFAQIDYLAAYQRGKNGNPSAMEHEEIIA